MRYFLCSSIPLNFAINTVVVTIAAMISLTGSAKNTANTLSESSNGNVNISGINSTIFILPSFLADKVFAVFLAEPISDILAATVTTITFLTRFDKILEVGVQVKKGD